jgi:hypothetical protein
MDNILNIFGELQPQELSQVKEYAATLVIRRLQRTISDLESNRSLLIKEKSKLAAEVIDLSLKLEDSNGS